MFALSRVELGYAPDHVLTLHVSGSWGETADMAKLGVRVDRTLDGLRSLPGVAAASTAAFAPGTGSRYLAEFAIDGHPGTGHEIQADSRTVSAGYFETLRLPILLGTSCRVGSPTPRFRKRIRSARASATTRSARTSRRAHGDRRAGFRYARAHQAGGD